MRTGRTVWLFVAIIAIAAAFWYRQSIMRPPTPPAMGSVIVITGGPGPYWKTIAEGAQVAAGDLDVQLRVESPKNDENVEQQTAILSSLDLTGVAGVAVSPLDAEGQTPLIDQIAEKAVVVTFDSDAPSSKRDTYIGTSNYAAGQRVAELVREAVPEGGKLVVLLANRTKDNMRERREGFEDALDQAPSVEESGEVQYAVVDFLVDEGTADKCRELATSAIKENQDLACIVGMNVYHGPLLRKLLAETDRLGKIKLIVFDDEPETLEGVEKGDIYATVAQDPYLYGYRAVERIAATCRDGERLPPLNKSRSTYNVSVQTIRQGDVAGYREQVKQRLAAAEAR